MGAEIAAWTGRIGHEELQAEADKILVDAAAAGADLDGLQAHRPGRLRGLARPRTHPDEDPPGKGSRTASCMLDTTLDGAGRITGDLTPECAAAVTAVVEALGKSRGPEDYRTSAQPFHDALQEGCQLLIRAKMVPDRQARHPRRRRHPPVGDLLRHGRRLGHRGGVAARPGRGARVPGREGRAGHRLRRPHRPVVTGGPDWDLIAQMTTLVTDA